MENGSFAQFKTLYVVSLNHFVNDSSTFLVASLFPAMEIAFKFSILEIGVLVAIGYVVNMVFQPLAGNLTQRQRPEILLAIGIGIMAGSMAMFATSTEFITIVISMLFLRLGSSFFHPVGAFIVSQKYSGNRLDSAMGFESAFGNLGIVMAFVSSVPAYIALGWSGPFIIYGILEAGTVIVTLATLGRESRVRPGVNKPTVKTEFDYVSVEHPNRETPKKKFILGLPLFFITTAFISGGSNAIFGNFGNLLLFHSGFGIELSNYLMAIWVASAFLGAILSGKMIKKLTRMGILLIAYLVSGVAMFIFSVYSSVLSVVIVFLFLSGFMLSITYPTTYSELSEYARKNLSREGSSFGILFSSQIGGSAVLGLLGGYLADQFGLSIVFRIASLLLVASTLMVAHWIRTNRTAGTTFST